MSFLNKFLKPKRPNEIPELGRNDLCWCGSGKKYKRCHLDSDKISKANQRSKSMKSQNAMSGF